MTQSIQAEFTGLVEELKSGAKDLRDVCEFLEKPGLSALGKTIVEGLPAICAAAGKGVERYMVQLKTSLGFLEKEQRLEAMKIINHAVYPGLRSGMFGGAGAGAVAVSKFDMLRKGM